MEKDFNPEYVQLCLTIRHYSALRFAMRTLFLVLFIGLAVIGFGIIPQQSFLVKATAKTFGFLATCFFWACEKNAARYMSHMQERAAELEKLLGYHLWSGMPQSVYWFVGPSVVTPLVYGGIALFWLYAMVFIR